MARGPTSVSGSIGSPTLRASIPSTNRRSNSSGVLVDDEALRRDARLAVVDLPRLDCGLRGRASMSALGITMKGSLPPSSSTVFLIVRPAGSATLCPGGFAAREGDGPTRGSAMTPATVRLRSAASGRRPPESRPARRSPRSPGRTAARWMRASAARRCPP